MIEIIRSHESDEFLGYFPHLKDIYLKQKQKYDSLIESIEKSIMEIENKKEEISAKYIFQHYPKFAAIIKKYFEENKKISVEVKKQNLKKKIIKEMDLKKILQLLKE
jgi:galactokinase/mevalonate kinase-like predicted kinase